MFDPVRGKPDLPATEASIGRFWRDAGIYRKSLDRRRGGKRFVFFEGPPTANGMPHPGHCLTRAIKDLYPRYRTMRGEYCERRAGWDTHGLPVEVEVCKELGIHSKAEIEAYGIEPFIHRCQESVWRYMKEWEALTERIGFWIDLSDAYVTYHQSYVESVWWALAELFDRGLLYRGHKIVWWWPQGGTALSSGEVGQGYREVADPSVYVAFPLCDEAGRPTRRSLVAWTTTPWTLPSNQVAAVKPDLDYRVLREADAADGPEYIVAAPLADGLGEKMKKRFDLIETLPGAALVGRSYLPPFDTYRPAGPSRTVGAIDGTTQPAAWRVVAADFVTTDSGTGVVHVAPAFGEVDYGVLLAEQARFPAGAGPTLLNCVAPDGTFTDEFPMAAGRFVKECDRDITRDLRARGLLVHQEQYVHDYPFCWRADNDPLIQYPRSSNSSPTTPGSTGCPSTSRRGGSAISWKPTSTGRSRGSGTGARPCRSGSASRPAGPRPCRRTRPCWRSPGRPAPRSSRRRRRPIRTSRTTCGCTSPTSPRSPTTHPSRPARG